jgi:hypothetical protein
MRQFEPDKDPALYRVYFSDEAMAEADSAFLWLLQHTSEAFATRWFTDLLTGAERIAAQPESYDIAPENEHYQVEVRQWTYRQAQTVYRVLFHVLPPDAGEDEGTINILHVRNARLPVIGASETQE